MRADHKRIKKHVAHSSWSYKKPWAHKKPVWSQDFFVVIVVWFGLVWVFLHWSTFCLPDHFDLQHPQCNVYLIACNSCIYRQVPQGLFIVLPHSLLHGMVVNIFHKYCIATWFLILKEHSLDECSKSGMRGHVLICLYSLYFVILPHKNKGKKFHTKKQYLTHSAHLKIIYDLDADVQIQ